MYILKKMLNWKILLIVSKLIQWSVTFKTQLPFYSVQTYLKDSSGRIIRTSKASMTYGADAEFDAPTTIEDGAFSKLAKTGLPMTKTANAQIEGNGVDWYSTSVSYFSQPDICQQKKGSLTWLHQTNRWWLSNSKRSYFITGDTLFRPVFRLVGSVVDHQKKRLCFAALLL